MSDSEGCIPDPIADGYTIYSKSGCYYCTKVKELLAKETPVKIIMCDNFLFEDRTGFLEKIKSIANDGKDTRTFPIVFHCGTFLGGYEETKKHYDKLSLFTSGNEDDCF